MKLKLNSSGTPFIYWKYLYNKFMEHGRSTFNYSEVGKCRILANILRLAAYRTLGKTFVTAKVNNYRMILDLKTQGLSEALFVYGKREILDTYLVQKEVKGDINVLDLGANIGYYAVMEALQINNGKVYALEPDPRNIQLLTRNVKLNGLDEKIEIYPYAASDKNERKNFYLAERTNVSGFINNSDLNSTDTIETNCVKLDDFSHINDIDFIRMDIEGYEVKVLEGAREFLTNTKKPIKILIEVHSDKYNDNELNFLKQLDYLFKIGFYVKYLIAKKEPEILHNLGYKIMRNSVEMENFRSLYQNIRPEDTLKLIKNNLVRSLMIEKTPVAVQ